MASESANRALSIDADDVCDIHVDAIMSVLTPYGVTVHLQRQDMDLNTSPLESRHITLCRARMSHTQAWVLVQKLGQLLDAFFCDAGSPPPLPENVLSDLGLVEAYRELQEKVNSHGR